MEEWWVGGPSKPERPLKMAREEDESILFVKREVRKRSLFEVGEATSL